MTLPPHSPTAYKSYLAKLNADIDDQICKAGIHATDMIESQVAKRTQAVDNMLIGMFHERFGADSELGLFAIGGYGRGELFPRSDVDILILGDDADSHKDKIEQFVASLWDIGITPAISVQSVADLSRHAKEQTVATALLDARFLVGSRTLMDIPSLTVKRAWTLGQFYHTKINEAKQRHLAHHATEYTLEPNIKNGVGGLRDIHIIGWLHRFYGIHHPPTPDPNIAHHAPTLTHAKRFFWLVRHHLHTLAVREMDKLAFDTQKPIAERLGFLDNHSPNAQAEALMRQYYHHAMTTASLSELLSDDFAERYLGVPHQRTDLDDDFCQLICQNDAFIAIQDTDLFINKPSAMLTLFLKMGKYGIKKIQATTLTALSSAVRQIDDTYRANLTHKALFLANLQENNYLFHRLRLMKRTGVLGAYLPAFGQIMGLMQFDLFHRYTVDAHTLYLIRILHRFGDSCHDEYQQKFDLVSQIYQHIHRKDILAITALFHDIAKGRGGDHSELGAVDAHEFCASHGMSDDDTAFISWLVRHHLTMSLTAQKKDIYDPDVIGEFARLVGSVSRLNHLYVLTVADMNATNSQLWNTWRASLLKQLYLSTHKALTQGETDPTRAIKERKERAKGLLNVPSDEIDKLWAGFGDEYFLTQKSSDIAWQTSEIITHKHRLNHTPIISLKPHSDLALDAVLVFICTPDQANLFATSVCVLDKLGLSVLDANILTADIDGKSYALDSYIVIDRFAKRDDKGRLNSDFLTDRHRQDELRRTLMDAFWQGHCQVASTLSDPALKHFSVPTKIEFSPATTHAHIGHHLMHLITKDRPALLAKVGQVFCRHNIKVHGARITTLGERAEDIFYISSDTALDDGVLDELRASLIAVLG
ncbi:MAG: [protein-PII] uridylyltransferase [Moraxella sp.]|nr:[protein-PII] uridylyltransferase [Moraxella sp.]